ncbi:MAG: carbohydrate ABC transporter permease [Butyrivibrio sp.]|jgi:multiple sugar transport system permease protein|nr:carbohydrate ABC transporter permease [Butyrivibrio sp.]
MRDEQSEKWLLWSEKIGRLLLKIVRGTVIVGICFIILQPLFVKLSVSFMSEKDLYDSSVKYIAKHFTLSNYQMALSGMDYWRVLFRTLVLSVTISLLQLFACLLTAYGFARFRFPFKNLLFGCVIFTLIVPPQVIMLPLFMKYRFFDIFGLFSMITGGPVNLIDSYWPFIMQACTCMGIRNGLYIYMLRQFFKGMPRELEEAAFVDGCGKLRTFIQIMLPSAVPMMVTVFLFGFVWQWTDSFYTSLYLNNTKVISSSLSSLAVNVYSSYEGFGGSMNFISPGFVSMINNTGTVLSIIPLIILYLICQKSFVEGIERSGIVG